MNASDATALASDRTLFGPDKIFTYLFLTIGPTKALGPFAKMTAGAEPSAQRSLALKGVAIATLGLVATGFVGQSTVKSWGVSLPALIVAGGIILFLVAIRSVLDVYSDPAPSTTLCALSSCEAASKSVSVPHAVLTLYFFASSYAVSVPANNCQRHAVQ
jgi:multiple antibiotic resistance protein